MRYTAVQSAVQEKMNDLGPECITKERDSMLNQFRFPELNARIGKIVYLLLPTILCSLLVYAQGGGNVAITGIVKDPSGAVVPNARVTVTQQGTTVERTTITNANGQFSVPSLPPATYTVAIEGTGFKKSVQTITLLADQVRALDVVLELGNATQVVNVE